MAVLLPPASCLLPPASYGRRQEAGGRRQEAGRSPDYVVLRKKIYLQKIPVQQIKLCVLKLRQRRIIRLHQS